jgi:hypothetical protein
MFQMFQTDSERKKDDIHTVEYTAYFETRECFKLKVKGKEWQEI